MSVVSGVTLVFTVAEDREERNDFLDRYFILEEINVWLAAQSRQFAALGFATDKATGSKHPQCEMYLGGYNYLDEDAFASFVMTRKWEYPENVVLVIEPEEGRTRVFRPDEDWSAKLNRK